ncbi:NADH-quinone oxidoreductase subunit NuoE [Amorphus orientalis]|uniref:NADH-quinone oxidoreductase subunit E n=1 Tax=Amorphus orientalis TaxID=649198 RepID=A0AAE4ASI0_9HYPH|nr:NADH-quinone oxidoreductase subunit NuoE [Amorphus orientalis]MDQ0316286.1 NADH-quinone oxidoreductase subunit E [Amorphus orientalis]
MAVRRLAEVQPDSFSFTPENLEWAKKTIAKYPEGRQASAVVPLLWRAQEQHGWLPEPAIRLVADMLDMPYIRVLENATFYTMFQLKPVGTTAHIQVCGTTPCQLRGAEELVAICKRRINGHAFEVSEDGRFSWEEVECLGACVNAPMVQVGPDTFEDLTPETFEALIDGYAAGKPPEPGPQSDRKSSEPVTGATSLTDPALYDGSRYRDDTSKTSAAADPEADTSVDPSSPEAAGKQKGRPQGEDDAEAAAARKSGLATSDEKGAPSTSTVHAADQERSETGPDPEAPPKVKAQQETPEQAAEADADRREKKLATLPTDASPEDRADAVGTKPELRSAEAGETDDLQQINGIGPKIESTLKDLGIHEFGQIADWTPDNVAWVETYLKFKGRVEREDWIEQAKTLAAKKTDKES